MARKKTVSNLRFSTNMTDDQQVIGWVVRLAEHLRRKPNNMARLAMERGCIEIAKENNIELVSAQPSG